MSNVKIVIIFVLIAAVSIAGVWYYGNATKSDDGYKNYVYTPNEVKGITDCLKCSPGVCTCDDKPPAVYHSIINTSQSSKLRALGDPIRGDLPILPLQGDWFVPYANPVNDLHRGAMHALGGSMNQTANQMAELVYNFSGGNDTIMGGVDITNCNDGTLILTS